MNDVILVKFEGERQSLLAPPFGVLYLAGSLRKAGFSTRVIHELGTEENIQSLIELASREKPVFIGFSTLTGLSLLPTAEASRAINKKCEIPIVWGGLHPTMLPEQTLENEFVHIVGIGEGERTVVELARVLVEHGLKSNKMAEVAGIGFRRNGKIVLTNPRPFIEDLDELYPDWEVVEGSRYFRSGRHFYVDQGLQLSGNNIGAIITSRGCPWRCGFCYNQFVNKRMFRVHSPGRVIEEIQHLEKRYNITGIVFEDDYFFANKDRGMKIIRQMNIPWSSNIRANHMARWGDEFAREVKQHNCMELRIGAESGSQRMLNLMQKDITVDQIRRAVHLCVKYDIPATLGFMIGLPGETWPDVLETLTLMDELEQAGAKVKTMGPGVYMPYPGTPLFELAAKYGFSPPQSLAEWSKSFWGPKQKLSVFQDRRIQHIIHYKTLISRKDPGKIAFSVPVKLLRYIAKMRWKHRFFRFPVDYTSPVSILNMLDRVGLMNISERLRGVMWEASQD